MSQLRAQQQLYETISSGIYSSDDLEPEVNFTPVSVIIREAVNCREPPVDLPDHVCQTISDFSVE